MSKANKTFSVGDRVRVYSGANIYIGAVSKTWSDGMVDVLRDDCVSASTWHSKQCRRLVKRERRRICLPESEVCEYAKHNWETVKMDGPLIEFIEVRRRK